MKKYIVYIQPSEYFAKFGWKHAWRKTAKAYNEALAIQKEYEECYKANGKEVVCKIEEK